MSKNRVLLSVITVVAIVSMASETATAQLFQGRLLGRRNQSNCCAPAPAPAPSCCAATPAPAPAAPCCGTPAPAPAAPCCGAAPAPVPAPAPAAPCCGGVAAAPTMAAPMVQAPVVSTAPMMTSAPIMSSPVSSCCGGGNVVSGQVVDYGNAVPMEGTVVSGQSYPVEGVVASETILEGGETVQASPSDSTVTSSEVVEPPAAADASGTAPEEEN